MRRLQKESVIVWVSVSSFVVGVVLVFLGLLLPERGSIDQSVLIAVGQFLALAATGLGLKEYVDGSITRAEMRHRAEVDGHDQ